MQTEQEIKTLEAIVRQACVEQVQSTDVTGLVESEVRRVIKEAIRSTFSHGSVVHKAITVAVQNAIPAADSLQLGNLALAVRQQVMERLSGLAEQTARDHMDKVFEELLPASAVVVLSDLRDLLRRKVAQLADCEPEDVDDCDYTFEIEHGDPKRLAGFFDIVLSEQAGAEKYSAKTTFLRFQSVDKGPDLKPTGNLFRCWAARVGSTDLQGAIGKPFCGPLYGIDAAIWRLASNVANLQADF